jgi:serine/threonine protein kinase
MSSSIGRRGWDSFPDTEDVALESSTSPKHKSSHEALTEVNQKLIWCNFIAQLQRLRLKPLRNSVPGLGDPIGSGTYFAVWRHRVSYSGEAGAFQDQDGKVLPRGTVVALKRVIPRVDQATGKIDLDYSKQLRAISLEVRTLSIPELRKHRNIVQMYCLNWESRGSSAAAAWPTLVLEYCEFNLSEYQNYKQLDLDEKLRIGTGIGSGLSLIHSLRIVHGDIKSDNILMKMQETGEMVPKLADFSCSLLDLRSNQADVTKSVRVGGTDPWRAPEVSPDLPRSL